MADYKFYNANPLNKLEQDCVCRAISRAMAIPYRDVERKLKEVASLFDCEELCVCCYSHLLEKVFGLTCKNANKTKVKDIINDYRDNILLIRIQGHLTMAEYGVCYDIWNCLDKPADVFWIVE